MDKNIIPIPQHHHHLVTFNILADKDFWRTQTVALKEEDLTSKMLKACVSKVVILVPLILIVGLISTNPTTAEEESGTTVPAESRPCVDCHAFEFMQRALQDLKKTAYNLDSRTETLLFKVEKRTLCDCLTANTLN
ncbi:NELL2-interacting cell ontogeny regulator 1 isoform X1 [Elgaria multicarinata webbii]|uniref:NELL2-interacting cell ontogeny regulator 1 isoform X1 n=2 Tax=Elgaria multicarinata webbii TaxID=159646 RepID=UPI002FCCC0C7